MTRSSRTWRGLSGLALAAAAASVAVVVPVREVGASVYGFDQPTAIVFNTGHLWIANYAGNTVTETTAAGAWVRTIGGTAYGFNAPDAIVSSGANVFVVNQAGTVTEVSGRTGTVVRVLSDTSYGFNVPTTAVLQRGGIWVVNSGGNSLTEFSAATGALVRNVSGTQFGFDAPNAIAVAGANLWVTSELGGSTTDPNAGAATEVNASTGAFVRRVTASADGLEQPSGVAFARSHVWIADAGSDAVTELNATGVLTRVITNGSLNGNYGFDAPTVVVGTAKDVYVISPPGASPMVTQIDTANGNGNWFECNTNSPDPQFANPTGLIVHGGYVWVVSPADNTLTQLSLALGGNTVNVFN